jgi:hypothetical protein
MNVPGIQGNTECISGRGQAWSTRAPTLNGLARPIFRGDPGGRPAALPHGAIVLVLIPLLYLVAYLTRCVALVL